MRITKDVLYLCIEKQPKKQIDMNTTFVIVFFAFAIVTLAYFAHFSLRVFAICFAFSVVVTAFAVSLLAFLL